MRRAFTLVELLVVCVILVIVGSLILGFVTQKKIAQDAPSIPSYALQENTPQSAQANGESIPITLHGNKFIIIYTGPKDAQIYPQSDEHLSR